MDSISDLKTNLLSDVDCSKGTEDRTIELQDTDFTQEINPAKFVMSSIMSSDSHDQYTKPGRGTFNFSSLIF